MAAFLMAVTVVCVLSAADRDIFTIGNADGLKLAVVNGDLMFRQLTSGPADGLPEIQSPGLLFQRDGLFIRVAAEGENQEAHSARHRWFLTADFSKQPARVILTETATENSTWVFEHSGEERGWLNHIRSTQSDAKESWLAFEQSGKEVRRGSTKVKLLLPVLASEKGKPFEIAPYKGPDGK